jgi:hypothetical protein
MFVSTNCLACGRTFMIAVEHFNTNRVAFHGDAGLRCRGVAGNGVTIDELYDRISELKRRLDDDD